MFFDAYNRWDYSFDKYAQDFAESNNGWYAYWSGRYPNLCSGEWTLFHNGEPVYVDPSFQGEDANTFGEYSEWYFDEDYMEQDRYYEDGLEKDEWINENKDYLKAVADESEWGCIFKAFQDNDWRHNSCGGCI